MVVFVASLSWTALVVVATCHFWPDLTVDGASPSGTVRDIGAIIRGPGDGIVLDGDAETEHERVFRFDWFSIEPPETADFRSASKEHG